MAAPPIRATTFQSIEVEAVGEDEYVNTLLWQGDSRVQLRSAYGGQVIAQALMAACHTVTDPDKLLLSAHCYFMSPVKLDSPVKFCVSRTKDGKVFCTRSVQVLQGDKVMAHCLASFKRPELTSLGLSHSPAGLPRQCHPPDEPRHLPTVPFDFYYPVGDSFQKHWNKLLAGEPLEPRIMSWLKIKGSLPEGSSQNVHRVALAFLSDTNMPHPLRLKYPHFRRGFVTSLDHTIWFHSPVKCDQTWFLQLVQCIQASEGTSLNSSHMYSEDGTLVATCQQQALFRLKSKL